MKRETKHDCPTDMHFSDKAGKCIQNGSEEVKEYSEDPSDRDKTPTKSLRFPTTKGRVNGVPNE